MYLNKMTDRSRKALARAAELALAWGSEFVLTEHLLYALVEDESSVAAIVLRKLGGIGRGAILKTLDKEAPGAPDAKTLTVGVRPSMHSPRLKQVLDLSVEESYNLGAVTIDTGHLLLALWIEEEGEAAKILRKFLEISVINLRTAVYETSKILRTGLPEREVPESSNIVDVKVHLFGETAPNQNGAPLYLVIAKTRYYLQATVGATNLQEEQVDEVAAMLASVNKASIYKVEVLRR